MKILFRKAQKKTHTQVKICKMTVAKWNIILFNIFWLAYLKALTEVAHPVYAPNVGLPFVHNKRDVVYVLWWRRVLWLEFKNCMLRSSEQNKMLLLILWVYFLRTLHSSENIRVIQFSPSKQRKSFWSTTTAESEKKINFNFTTKWFMWCFFQRNKQIRC